MHHVRLTCEHTKKMKTLAALTRRTVPGEVAVALDAHLERHRELLKSGAKMPNSRKP